MTDKVQKIKKYLVGMAGADCCDAKTKKVIKANILPFIDSLQEEPVSDDLEKFATHYADGHYMDFAEQGDEDYWKTYYACIAGAQWQRQKDEKYLCNITGIGSKHAEGKLKELLDKKEK